MLAQAQVKYKRKIDISRAIYQKVKNPNSYWVITWLGKSFFSESIIYREIIITNINNLNYSFPKDHMSFKVYIPEAKTFYFTLGTYLKYDGSFLKYPEISQNENLAGTIQIIDDVVIDPLAHYKTKYIHSKLKKTSYPVYNGDLDIDDYTYASAPYYSTFSDGLEIIIPNHVILSYFYYFSTLCIYSIIYGTCQEGLFSKIIEDKTDSPIILFNSTYIREEEASFISKFLLIEKGKGIEKLNCIHKNFYKNFYNNMKLNKSHRYYLDSKIPYDQKVKLSLIGRKIAKNKFLVFGIKSFDLFSNNPLFDYESYKLLDISDHSSINEKTKETILRTSQVPFCKDDNSIIFTNNSTNHNLGIIEITNKDISNKFSNSPIVKKLPKLDQQNSYSISQTLFQAVKEFSENLTNHNRLNPTIRANHISDIPNNIDYIQVVFDAVIELKNNYKYKTDYLYLKKAEFENSTYPPIKVQDIGTLILVSIISESYNYCLIVCSGLDRRMGLIRCEVPDFTFKIFDDPTIRIILIKMISKYNLYWDSLKKTQELRIHQVEFIHSFNHIKEEDHDSSVQSLVKRLKKFL